MVYHMSDDLHKTKHKNFIHKVINEKHSKHAI